MTKITFELDGKQVEAKPGETIWQVAKRQGAVDVTFARRMAAKAEELRVAVARGARD